MDAMVNKTAPETGDPASEAPPKPKKRLKQLGASDRAVRVAGLAAVAYLKLVRATSRIRFEPEDPLEAYRAFLPGIMTMWHGQHLMAPFVPHKGFNLKVMVSRHRDGEINAVIAEKFGYGTIRASAARTPSRTSSPIRFDAWRRAFCRRCDSTSQPLRRSSSVRKNGTSSV